MTTQNIFDLTDTWNAGATTFTAIKMNVTDTASATGSMLIDLQYNSTSLFHVLKSGAIHSRRSNYNIAISNASIIAVSNYSLTGSNADSMFDLAGTWNTSGTPTALKLNVTDTASNASSLLMDLQVGGTSQAKVSKGGVLTTLGRASINTLTVGLGGQTSVASNTALGFQTLNSASLTGGNNTAVGYGTLLPTTTGASNSACGSQALIANTTGSSNTGVGAFAINANTTGANNTAIGTAALLSAITQNNNTAVGNASLRNFDTSNNVAVGHEAARGSATVANNTGSSLTAVGFQALLANTSGANNAAFGASALTANTTGGTNSAFGHQSLTACTTGSNNVGIGGAAASTLTTGSRNTIIGQGTVISAVGVDDETVIGQGLTGKGADTAFIGGTNGAYNEKNVTTWETTSDARIKKNIADFSDGLSVIEALRVRAFEYRTPEEITELPQSAAIDRPGVQLGVIAQEIQQVLPACVTTNSTGVLSVSTDPLVWHLVNAVKQLSAEIKALKGE